MKNKYIIWNMADLLAVCTPAELKKLDTLVDRMILKKEAEGRPSVNQYIVVEADKPYAPEVRNIMKQHGDWD